MKLNKQTDYALRILMYAAVAADSELLSIQRVTDTYSLSRNHVMKIVHKLGQLGYLKTLRGKGGGFKLGRAPASINLGLLIRKLESSLVLVDCNQPPCRLSPNCQLKRVLAEAMTAFLAVLDQYTLVDLVANRGQLVELLTILEPEE